MTTHSPLPKASQSKAWDIWRDRGEEGLVGAFQQVFRRGRVPRVLSRFLAVADAPEQIEQEHDLGEADGVAIAVGGGFVVVTVATRSVVTRAEVDVANAAAVLTGSELSHTTGLHIPVDAGVASVIAVLVTRRRALSVSSERSRLQLCG